MVVLLVGRAVDAAVDVARQVTVLTVERVLPGLDHVDVVHDLRARTHTCGDNGVSQRDTDRVK